MIALSLIPFIGIPRVRSIPECFSVPLQESDEVHRARTVPARGAVSGRRNMRRNRATSPHLLSDRRHGGGWTSALSTCRREKEGSLDHRDGNARGGLHG